MNQVKYLPLMVFSVAFGLSACNSEPDAADVITQSSKESVAAVTIKPPSNTAQAENIISKIHSSEITVYKSPTCGCCKGWVTYLQEEGFNVTAIDHDDVDEIKHQHGLTDASLKSCHTAIVDGYIVEGHVPASDIERLLRERPTDIKGLSAPGMPTMSPGMGSRIPKDYDVLSFTKLGETAVYSQY